jgi:hypothetical protein
MTSLALVLALELALELELDVRRVVVSLSTSSTRTRQPRGRNCTGIVPAVATRSKTAPASAEPRSQSFRAYSVPIERPSRAVDVSRRRAEDARRYAASNVADASANARVERPRTPPYEMHKAMNSA